MTTRSPARGSRLRTALTASTVNGLYAVGGGHSYAHSGVYHCTVTVSAQGTAAVTAQFTEQWTG